MKLKQSAHDVLTVAAIVTGSIALVTAIVPDWIEVVFRVDPDGGDGSLERIVVLSLALGTLVLAAGARLAWKRSRRGAR